MHRTPVTAAALVGVLITLGACNSDDAGTGGTVAAKSTEERGRHGQYAWTVDLADDDGRLCIEASIQPTILRSTDSPDVDEFLDEQLWDPPACTPPLAASGPQFGLVFVPYLYQGDGYSQAVAIGLVVNGAEQVELVDDSGNGAPVEVEDNGTFVAFPTELVDALTLEVDGHQFFCPARSLGGGLGYEISHCDRA